MLAPPLYTSQLFLRTYTHVFFIPQLQTVLAQVTNDLCVAPSNVDYFTLIFLHLFLVAFAKVDFYFLLKYSLFLAFMTSLVSLLSC